MFNLMDDEITDKRLDNNSSELKNFSCEPWYIIAYVLNLGQVELDYILAEYPLLGHLSNTLIGHNIHREIPKDKVIKE